MSTATETSSAAGVRWDLSSLTDSPESAKAIFAESLEAAKRFSQQWKGKVATLTARELAQALEQYGMLGVRLDHGATYTMLRFSTDSHSQENLDLLAAMEKAGVEISNELRFLELEWCATPQEKADQLMADPLLANNRHWLAQERKFATHRLSEAEEQVWDERSPALNAWETLFEKVIGQISVEFDGATRTLDGLLSYLHSSNRELRLSALETAYKEIEPRKMISAHVYDTVVNDRLIADRLFKYSGPMEATHLRNEVEGSAVDQMMASVERNYPIAQRWFRAKAVLLGLPKLHYADQYAPLDEGRKVPYSEARTIINAALSGASPLLAKIADAFFADNRIDAEPRQYKRGGAFCTHAAWDIKPFVLANYTDTMRDVTTIAHELGHGMHFELGASKQTPLETHPGLAIAEVASTFAEMLTFDYLMEHETDPATRRALVASKVEESFATIFRQTSMAKYEKAAYDLRAQGTALTEEHLCQLWMAEQVKYYGDSMELPEYYQNGWAYIPHFIGTRFYTYAYSFADLVSLMLYGRWRTDGAKFMEQYIELLSAGGSKTPAELLAPVGIDLSRADVWDSAFAELERLVALAEKSV